MVRSLARNLEEDGKGVCLLVNEDLAPIFRSTDLPHTSVPVGLNPLLALYLKNFYEDPNVDAVVLADFFSNASYMDKLGHKSEALIASDKPTLTLNIWDYSLTGTEIDVFGDQMRQVAEGQPDAWMNAYQRIHRLSPVPIVSTTTASAPFNNLPAVAPSRPRCILDQLGIPKVDKVVLFCTAAWQQSSYDSDAAARFSVSLPQLLSYYIGHLKSNVHLIHIGPHAYDLSHELGHFYHWLPSLPPERFDEIVASVDLLVSANISATSIASAMVCNVPTLIVRNSFSIRNREEVEAVMPEAPSSYMVSWLERSLPLFPFLLWPLGYFQFLKPLLKDNPYMAALDVVELLDEQEMQAALHKLLFDPVARQERLHGQNRYLYQVRSLPTGAEAIRSILENS
jgi:hypothetical protein